MSAVVPMLARSRFQVFAFEVPRLSAAELETSLRHRVRSMTPLHEGQYRLWFHLERSSGNGWAYVFVTRPDQGPFRPEFPTRTPAGAPRTCVAVLTTAEGPLALLYEDGVLREAGPAGSDRVERWGDLSRIDVPAGWGSVPVPQPALKVEPFPWIPVLAALAALLLAVGGLAVQWSAKVERNALWKSWIAAHDVVKKPVSADLETLRKEAGIPLDDVFAELAAAWPHGVLIRSLHVDGWKIDLEADSVSGLASFQALTAQTGFRHLVLMGVRSLPDGRERMTARGDWSDGR